ncbi:XRE family transcriptional regulator [Desulfosporosinus fructosivorans]|uniref:XRE family transcriptional regulator n=1 Tax=Desulfosporosinus fructosivorans TaxID=2018669 RepID=A0A4Z0R282_9FIRM|nr:helix-turn-helix transcriptional regulator [Desulfosporosinus fructosivorans]TGE37192.1 XRE family transcriptional regulator [Desulfosporosinus fructosivorans]
MLELGKRLKEIRLTKGLSAVELSQRSGVARSLISQLETGKRQSTGIDTIYRLAQALEVSPTLFLNDEPPSNVHYNEDLSPFVLNEGSQPYLRLAQKAEKSGLSPDLLGELIDIIVRLRSTPPERKQGAPR